MKINAPVISVIIPCYNYGRFLPDACDSLLSQSMTNWECILVNNGRFEETRDAANLYVNRDSRFKYLESDSMGPSLARNEGLAIAQGEFVQFLDADDKLSPQRFSILLDLFARDLGLDLVYSGVKYFATTANNTYVDSLNDLSSQGKGGHEGSGEDLYNLLIRRNIFVINSPLIRREILTLIGGFTSAFTHLEDWDLWLRSSALVRKFQFANDERALAFVRSHQTSLSQNTTSMRSHYLPVLLSNTFYSRLKFKNFVFVYVIASEFIIDSFFNSNFNQVRKLLISTAFTFENYLKLFIHFILLPLYLPIYIVLKLYRKLVK